MAVTVITCPPKEVRKGGKPKRIKISPRKSK